MATWATLIAILALVSSVRANTDSSDVQALGVLYTSLNSPPQLTNWAPSGGDPCGNSWKGISCSGSAVTAIQLSGMGLNGTLGYRLSDLASLKTLDLSDNNIHDSIPYQLPPNVTYLNLGKNNFSGNLPYSFSQMGSLTYLNLSHNSLFQQIGDIFGNLKSLSELDFSFNNFSGNLPNSFSLLSNLSSLYLENNQLSGSVNMLSSLALKTLNIANNNFSGWIPQEFNSIPNLIIGGNSFANGPAPPPPPFTPPPPGKPHTTQSNSPPSKNGPEGSPTTREEKKQGLATGALIGIIAGSVFAALCIIFALVLCLRNVKRTKNDDDDDDVSNGRSDRMDRLAITVEGETNKVTHVEGSETPVATLKPPPIEKQTPERVFGKTGSMKKQKVPMTATSYTVAALQVATNSFSQDSLLGEGSLGRVYKAEFPNGKTLAVKKVDSAAVSLQDEDIFLDAVSNMSRLRHPNIIPLVGYCIEHGQRLLVYEYVGNGTLHEVLHFSDDTGKRLNWNARVKIALGTARALEYLHEVCLPSVVHRNFKSANVLLDEELNPHLSDCGIASLAPNTERQVSTEVVGSFGYSAPEFAMSGIYTVKSDVYSFGVVMLELLTGRKPLDSSRSRAEQSLVRWAAPQLHDIDSLSKMVDPALNGMYPAKSLSRFADIIALCVQPEPEFRPPMSEVVQQLVRLMQRASIARRRSGEELGLSYRAPEHEQLAPEGSF
ncbi:Protein STRUBBELIG-RECEPTOR FAMILY 8 [Rhynchospora pubera]|uniref:Protein STRUBBELIG-RECEPTOR FAMILY 8 n=1 Tax=Rhynchospora pubera TaxID=906938 RepID=A0AAV8BXY3_9POAL|nr:Protein STRUBBELIG-RECEPTOR FAMILY 8 [Rhynchospora pubera]